MHNPESFIERGELINSETVKKAQEYFSISEEAARAVDELSIKILRGEPVTIEDVVKASSRVRRSVFNRGCDILGLTEVQRNEIIENT